MTETCVTRISPLAQVLKLPGSVTDRPLANHYLIGIRRQCCCNNCNGFKYETFSDYSNARYDLYCCEYFLQVFI